MNSAVHDEREGRQRELRTDEMGQHAIEVLAHSFPKLALRPGLHEGQCHLTEGATIVEQKYRQDGNHDKQPGFFGGFGNAYTDPLCDGEKIIAVTVQKSLGVLNGSGAPAAFLPNGDGNISRTNLIKELRHGVTQTLCLMADLGADKKEESDDQHQKQEINDAHGDSAAVRPPLHS